MSSEAPRPWHQRTKNVGESVRFVQFCRSARPLAREPYPANSYARKHTPPFHSQHTAPARALQMSRGRSLDGCGAARATWREDAANPREKHSPAMYPEHASKRTATHCPYCAFQCGMYLAGSGDAPEVAGNPEFPVNKGALCVKGWSA